jgi:transposase
MKKLITAKTKRSAQAAKGNQKSELVLPAGKLTIGVDLGDRESHYCILDEAGEVVRHGKVATTKAGIGALLEKMPCSRVALEVGTHSPWVSRLVSGMGHEVIVANPHKVKLIAQSTRKNDRVDAEQLARLARVDPKLLSPIRHRGETAQADLAVIKARAGLVKARTMLINEARGLVKAMGERLKPCDVDQVKASLVESVAEELRRALKPLLKIVEEISEPIREYEREIEQMQTRYPEVELLTQVYGVGVLIALTFLLTLDDPGRFVHSRDVGPYLGLVPKQRDSGERQPQLGISKAGDRLLRSLLVQGAHCILREGSPESDLQAWGRARMGEGGKRGKKRTVVAVARKLAVLLHHLWVSGEVYDPQYNRKAREQARGQAAA